MGFFFWWVDRPVSLLTVRGGGGFAQGGCLRISFVDTEGGESTGPKDDGSVPKRRELGLRTTAGRRDNGPRGERVDHDNGAVFQPIGIHLYPDEAAGREFNGGNSRKEKSDGAAGLWPGADFREVSFYGETQKRSKKKGSFKKSGGLAKRRAAVLDGVIIQTLVVEILRRRKAHKKKRACREDEVDNCVKKNGKAFTATKLPTRLGGKVKGVRKGWKREIVSILTGWDRTGDGYEFGHSMGTPMAKREGSQRWGDEGGLASSSPGGGEQKRRVRDTKKRLLS